MAKLGMIETIIINKDNTIKNYSFVNGLSLDEILAKGGKYAIVFDGVAYYYLENTNTEWQILDDKVIAIPGNVYLNFAICPNNTLTLVDDNYFASRAWRLSDKAFSKIIGRKFGHFSLKDGQSYCDDKRYFRRLQSLKEFKKLLPNNVVLIGEPTFEKVL